MSHIDPTPPEAEEKIMPAKAPSKPEAAAMAEAAPIATVPGDLLAIAMRILNGELNTIEITPDMVGKSLAFEGTIWAIDGPLPSSTSAPASKTPPAGGRGASRGFEGDALLDRISSAFEAFPDEWMGVAQVAGLIDNLAGVSDGAHRQNIARRLASMVETGILQRRNAGTDKKTVYSYKLVR